MSHWNLSSHLYKPYFLSGDICIQVILFRIHDHEHNTKIEFSGFKLPSNTIKQIPVTDTKLILNQSMINVIVMRSNIHSNI